MLAGVVLLGMTVGPRVLHYRTATMLTGSMVPTINPGDVIVDVEEPATDLKVGQIISYHIPVDDHRVESHRVTWVHITKDGAVAFRTKGDANNGADPWTARSAAGSSVWIVKTVLPVVGDVIRFMRQPLVQLALTRVVPAILIISCAVRHLAPVTPQAQPGRREAVRSAFVALLALLLAAIPAAASAKFTRVTTPAAMSVTSDTPQRADRHAGHVLRQRRADRRSPGRSTTRHLRERLPRVRQVQRRRVLRDRAGYADRDLLRSDLDSVPAGTVVTMASVLPELDERTLSAVTAPSS